MTSLQTKNIQSYVDSLFVSVKTKGVDTIPVSVKEHSKFCYRAELLHSAVVSGTFYITKVFETVRVKSLL